ncbi:MAG TPA: Gfo/Idh/MocA family oxidoreductase [Clostridia bacterium]|jgi:predicted dehydrogenase|nr:Gfo/Idh/MocA family oxidoreductase [Clostridia bacterium]
MCVKVAVIGIGRMGRIHARNLRTHRIPHARLVAVCDIDKHVLEAHQRKYKKIPTYLSYKDMLEKEDIDAVIIATPHYEHGKITKYCIEKDKHVLVEKPMTVTAYEAESVIKKANEKPSLITAVMWNQRTNPIHQKARKLVSSGAIGKIIRANYIIANWYRSQAYYNQGGWRASYSGEGGGTLINQCVHQLDLLQWILGMPKAVESKLCTKGRDITTENDVACIFTYPDNVYLILTASTHELRGTNRFEIAGDKGRIVIENNKMTVYTFKKSEPEVNAETKQGYGFVTRKTKRYSYTLRFISRIIWYFGEQACLIKNFINAIRGKEKLLSPIKDGLGAVQLVNGIYASSWRGEKMAIPVDPVKYEERLRLKIEDEKAMLAKDTKKHSSKQANKETESMLKEIENQIREEE